MLDSKEKIEQRQSTSVGIKLPWGIKGIEEIQQRTFSFYENDIFYSVILLLINFVYHGN